MSRRSRIRNRYAKRFTSPKEPPLRRAAAPSSMPVQPLLGQWAPAHAGAGSRAAPLRRWCIDSSVLRAVATLALCACAGSAAAQLSGTLSGVSDYRYRGNTLTHRLPAAQAGVAYDNPHGWYAGAFGSTVRL